MSKSQIITLLALSAAIASMTACNDKDKSKLIDSSQQAPIKVDPPAPPAPPAKKMVVTADFGETPTTPVSSNQNYRMVEVTTGKTPKLGCEVEIPDDVNQQNNITCLLEGNELDLGLLGAKITVSIPDQACKYINQMTFFYNDTPGTLGGPAMTIQPKAADGFPAILVHEPLYKSFSFTYVVPSSSLFTWSNLYIANYYPGFPYYDPVTNPPPTAFYSYIDDITGKTIYPGASYYFECVDAAEEVSARIDIAIREYDVLSDYIKGPKEITGQGDYINNTYVNGHPNNDRLTWYDRAYDSSTKQWYFLKDRYPNLKH